MFRSFKRIPALFLALLFGLLVAACGGGGGGGSGSDTGGGSNNGGNQPTLSVSVIYPPGDVVHTEETITVRGTSNAAAVRVNGVAATSTDGFKSWVAEVPLEMGENAILIEAEDSKGATKEASRKVKRVVTPYATPDAIAYHKHSGEALVVDSTEAVLFALDVETGERRVISSANVGEGPSLVYPVDVAVGPAGQVLVLDLGARAIFEVDLENGNRSVITSDAVGSGEPMPALAKALVWDPLSGIYMLAIDTMPGALFRVGYATGSREKITLSGATIDEGDEFYALGFDPYVSPRLILGTFNGGVYTVDPQNGVVHEVRPGEPDSFGFLMIGDIEMSDADTIVLAERFRLCAVRLSDGNVSDISYGSVRGEGPSFDRADAVTILPSGEYLVVDQAQATVLAVDAEGDRRVFSEAVDAAAGSGPSPGKFDSIVFDVSSGYGYYRDAHRLGRLHLDEGKRELVALEPVVDAVAGNTAGNTLLVRSNKTIYTVELATDTATENATIAGNPYMNWHVFDEATNELYALSAGGIYAHSIESTASRLVSAEDGQLIPTAAVAIDRQHDRLLGINWTQNDILGVDLANGARTLLVEEAGAAPLPQGGFTAIVAPGDDHAYLAHQPSKDILRVNLSNLEHEVFPLEQPVTGQIQQRHSLGMGLDFERQLAWYVASDERSVYVQDLMTGDRSIISR